MGRRQRACFNLIQFISGRNTQTRNRACVEEYERLLGDLHDLAVVAERRSEKPISIEEMKRRMGR